MFVQFKFSIFIAALTACGHALAAEPCAAIEHSTAVYENGKLRGCRLDSVAPDSMYAKLGLKPGQIVAPANSGGAHAMELYSTTKSSDPQDANATPNQQGFKLVTVNKGSVYEKIGLKSGDVILSCNGKKIESAQDAQSIYQTIRTEPHVKFEIQRDGQNKTIEANLKPVSG